MKVLIIDQLSMFIQGMLMEIKKTLPDADVIGANTFAESWRVLESDDISVVLLDGDMDYDSSIDFMDKVSLSHPNVHIVMMMMKVRNHILQAFLKHHALGVISKSQPIDTICHVIQTAGCGMVCVPSHNVTDKQNQIKLSERQKEILQLIAAGESNKQISRLLNISSGTVKTHLESIYRRLNVKNRTQAAMMLSYIE